MDLKKLYQEINQQTTREYPDVTLTRAISQVCDRYPDRIAIVSDDDYGAMTYQQLEQRSNQLANWLRAQGVSKGDFVGVCVRRDSRMIAWLLGVMKLGAAYVPLDSEYPADRLAYMAEDSGISHLVTDSSNLQTVKDFDVATTNVDKQHREIANAGDDCPTVAIDPASDVAYVIYTSGSTGKPKGVLVPHRGVVNMIVSLKEALSFSTNDVMLATSTLAFDISVSEIFMPLFCGGSIVVVDRSCARDSTRLIQACQTHNITVMFATPAMWRMILEADFSGNKDMVFLTGGEPLPADLVAPMLDRCRELWNLYGPTETTVFSTYTQIVSADEKILIGVPANNTSVFIVDEDNNLCPPGKPGELLIGGDGVTLGYLNRQDLTAEKFIQFNGQRVYRSGDLAQLTDDGQIDCLGRMDGQVKLDGHRIELGEIDVALAGQDGVRMATAILREDRPGDKRLVGYMIAEDGKTIDVAAVRKNLGTQLPEYMVPAILTTVSAFPMTDNGKLDRKSFPVPSEKRPEIGIEYVAPVTDPEKQLAQIWGGVLQIDGVGTRDNFFQLGGSSLRAVRAVAQMKQQANIDISNAEFFDNPTIEAVLKLADKKAELLKRFGSKTEDQSKRDADEHAGQYAIVGMSARFPGADNLEQFWDNLLQERESITFFSPEELDRTLDPRDTTDSNYVAARGIIEGADEFDAHFFKIMPKSAELIDPQQRMMLEISWTALEDAGVVPSPEKTIGIWAGTFSTTYHINNVLTNPEIARALGSFQLASVSEKDFIATRVAHALNLTGPAINLNTACSTSLVTLVEACKSLSFGHCDVAIAGAVSIHFPQMSGHLFQEGSIATPDGHCRPFDADGQGTMFSDGAGAVVVKRLADAIADGDRIYAVVKGTGINNDGGEKASFSAPSIAGQAGAIAMAQADARVTADQFGLIEAHGTATPVGDPIEVAALQTVFDAQTDKRQYCAIGSVKSNIGHAVAAAGVAGLIKAAMSLHTEQIPATLHFKKPNPQIDFTNSPFFVCDSLKPWPRGEEVRLAGVSAFGVGGTNAHVVLQEAPAVAQCDSTDAGQSECSSRACSDQPLPVSVLPVSGKTEAALLANVSQLAEYLTSNQQLDLIDVANTLQTGRAAFTYRSAVVVSDLADAAETLTSAKAPRFIKRKSNASKRSVVFMFPGQGAQYVRMGQNLYETSSVFKMNFDHCAEVLLPLLERDLRDVLFPQSGEEDAVSEILRNTRFTQPALFALGYSLAQVWLAWGIEPSYVMGHSIGEFAAACVAGVFSLDDGLKMIAERGRAMEALPGGSMMSVRLPGKTVEPMLWGDMAIGSYNGPELCVVAGPNAEVADLQKQLEADDVVCRHLYTSHAFHSPMMDAIVDPFAKFVGQFKLNKPSIPILSTVTSDWMTEEQATDARYWANHLRQPVQFSGAVTKMWDEDPTRILIELGPRKTLSTLAKQHASDPKNQIAIPTLSDNAEGHTEWTSMLNAVANLWVAGVDLDWDRLTGDGKPIPRKKISLPTYAFQRKRYFLEPPVADQTTSISNSSPPVPLNDIPEAAVPVSFTNPTLTTNSQPTQTEPVTMSRIPSIITAIESVFENTSGFELADFDGDTTFFEMGLDSLVLTQTATALKKEMEVEITFRQMLEETPTVDSLAAWFDENLPADKYAAVALPEPVEAAAPAPASSDAQPAPVAQPQAPTTVATTPVVPQPAVQMPMQSFAPVATGDVKQDVINSQLQIMQAQLQLLAGQPMAAAPATTAQASGVVAPVQPAATTAAVERPATAKAETKTQCSAVSQNPQEVPPKAKRFSTVKLNDGTLDEKQQAALDEIIRMNCAMLPKSKAYAQEHRKYMADPRTVSGFRPNMKEMTHPIVVERSQGVNLWDIDGNEYIDFTCGFGSNFLGHSHAVTVKAITEQVQKDYAIGPQSPLAGEVAKLFCELTGNERMAFSNTGSEAVLGCTRLARNKTGRDLIVMFNGDYHGILDEVLSKGNKKLKSFPAATGIPQDHVGNTLILEYGSDEAIEIIRERMDEIAAILVEPVQSRKPELQPREFLQELRRMTDKEPTALIFDEVITGLRVGYGGAQEHFGVKADLAAYGKVVGGGMPIGVLAGKAEYMDGLDGGYWEFGDDSRPEAGMTYFAGTFVRHPLTLAASKAIMLHLKESGQAMYDRVNGLTDYMRQEMNRVFKELDAPMEMANFGSLFKIQFHQELVYSEVFFAGLRRRGMHIWDHRPCLLTIVHEQEHVDELVQVIYDTIVECQRHGFMPGEGYKKVSAESISERPPQKGAKLGKDESGNPGWFVADAMNPGQFVQVGITLQ